MATPIDLTDKNYFGSANVAKDSIVLNDRYFYIDGSTVVEYSDKVSSFKAQLIDKDGVDVKAGGDAKGLIADGKSATFANATATTGVKASDLKDGIFVAIVKTEVVDTNKPITPAKNAKWGWSSSTNVTTDKPAVIGTDDKGNTTITLYNDETGKLSSAKKAENITTKSVVKRGEDGNYDPAKNTVNVQISASFKDAVLTVTNECTDIHGLPFELESGAYQVTFEFTNADTGSYINVVYYVTVK